MLHHYQSETGCMIMIIAISMCVSNSCDIINDVCKVRALTFHEAHQQSAKVSRPFLPSGWEG